MQKKTDKFLDKIVKKDYHNELEKVLEKKAFDENTKSLLLSILYKIEAAYNDYQIVKPDVKSKEDFVQTIIDSIQNDCERIKIVKLNSVESKILGDKTFLVEKEKKRIICYPMERKLLYCIAKVSKKRNIIKNKYAVIDKTLADLLNVGSSIDMVEPMRDFNGYSWTTIPREIESTFHNLIYQNIRILVGQKFLESWIKNTDYIIDYMESFENRLEKQYGKQNQEKVIEELKQISVLLAVRYNPSLKSKLQKEKKEVEFKLAKVRDNQKFVQEITKEKKELTNEIKQMDETLNDKNMLQAEYERRNENLALEEKIFSIRILSQLMAEERKQKMKRLEKLNILLNPQKFVVFKKELEQKEKYLKLLDIKDLDTKIIQSILAFQKTFLRCYQEKVLKTESKQEIMNLIYEFRYYCLLPLEEEKIMGKEVELEEQIRKVQMLLLRESSSTKANRYFFEGK